MPLRRAQYEFRMREKAINQSLPQSQFRQAAFIKEAGISSKICSPPQTVQGNIDIPSPVLNPDVIVGAPQPMYS